MRELKRLIAKTGLKIDGGSTLANIQNTFIVGLFAFVPSAMLVENLPMDNSDKRGSEIAVAEYNDALKILTDYNADHGIETSPSGLRNLLSSDSDDDTEINTHNQNAAALSNLSREFGEAVIIDNRLSEKQKYDLTQEFETTIGDFTEFTGLIEPDFADLDETIAKLTPTTNESAFAEEVADISHKVMRQGDTVKLQIGIALLWLVLSLSASSYPARLQTWRDEPKYKKPPKYKH